MLCDAYSNALFKANEIHALTVSFPCISTGVYGFPPQKAAEIAIGTILSMLPQYDHVAEVFFICREDENYLIYKNLLSNIDDPNIQILIS
ncbi:regulator of RNase III activity [Acinetobacter sp. 1566109]|nr:regulator of RNase III activity [Acinetobacter sp. 1566109]